MGPLRVLHDVSMKSSRPRYSLHRGRELFIFPQDAVFDLLDIHVLGQNQAQNNGHHEDHGHHIGGKDGLETNIARMCWSPKGIAFPRGTRPSGW